MVSKKDFSSLFGWLTEPRSRPGFLFLKVKREARLGCGDLSVVN